MELLMIVSSGESIKKIHLHLDQIYLASMCKWPLGSLQRSHIMAPAN